MWGDKAGYFLRHHDSNVAKVDAARRAAELRGLEPADEKQKQLLKELGIEITPDMTKAEAEALIYRALMKDS